MIHSFCSDFIDFFSSTPFWTGKSYTMIGKDDSMQNLGIIPCAISWLFKLINERKEKTGARFSVRISAVEVWGKEENLRDLLSEVATGSLQDGQSPGVYLCEDPICGMQVNTRLYCYCIAVGAVFFLGWLQFFKKPTKHTFSTWKHLFSNTQETLWPAAARPSALLA